MNYVTAESLKDKDPDSTVAAGFACTNIFTEGRNRVNLILNRPVPQMMDAVLSSY